MSNRQQQTEWNVVPGNKVPIGAPLEPTNSLLFSPLTIKNTTFHNRIVVSPMCQYSCVNGVFDHLYHMAHYGSYALRGPGLMFIEASGVLPEGRISPEDMGIWSPEHRDAFIPIIQLSHKTGVKIGIQLAHAGRKASTYSPFRKGSSAAKEGVEDEDGGWTPEGPSAIPWNEHFRVPHEMTEEDIARTVAAFGQSAKWCDEVGFDVVEIHGAHGYLITEFLSPLSNRRTDKYGGSFENRIRFLLEVLESVQQNWPKDKPLFVRLSVTEWHDNPNEESWDLDQTLKLAAILKEKGVDLIDCSSGGNTSTQKFKPADPQVIKLADAPAPQGSEGTQVGHHTLGSLETAKKEAEENVNNPVSMFQVPFAIAIKQKVGIKTGAVGFITHPYQMESIIRSNQADLVFMAREFLRDPNLVYNAADQLGVKIQWLPQHERGREM
ncbi:NADH:flavin oxidoreductase/NADH oxidase [Umbelopsis sp. PMI_123]|nr:NADH:flavin oxidoreductase/NADH oxidase [Umbelopsis sp. PMI_123]